MKINQVLVGAAQNDAVTNAALNTRALLRKVGPSEIYSRFIDEPLHNDVLELKKLMRTRDVDSDDIIIFHASIGDKVVEELLFGRPERIVLVYHNISPASAFEAYDPMFAESLTIGRAFVAKLRDRVCLALADSEFNASELRRMGYSDVRVSPLLLDFDRLVNTPSDWSTANHVLKEMSGPIILSVAQLLPHKRPDLLLQAFHILVTYLRQDANLVMVGPSRIHSYDRMVADLKDELNLHRAWIAGSVPPEQLVSFYRAADVFVTTSEHEGFCVPLIEAMRFRVPIIARANAAIPDTLQNAGILLPSDAGPELLAEAMFELIESQELQAHLRVRGEIRSRDYSLAKSNQAFLENLLSVA